MWIILRYKKNNFQFLINDLRKKFKNDLEIYNPKFKTNLCIKNKFISSELTLLGDYFFCHHKEFNNSNIIYSLKFTKGLKDFIQGYKSNVICYRINDVIKNIFNHTSHINIQDKYFKLINYKINILQK